MRPDSPRSRECYSDGREELGELAHRGVEVAVIGGGINGAGIARAAALRGYSVLLLEAADYGWGTTWRSTKLIHGGLRYLEHGEISLVFESLRDRSRLLAEYPGMVKPLEFLLPVYRGDRHGPAVIGLGLTMYDVLSFRPRGRRLPRHRRLSPREAHAAEPGLRRQGLRAGFTYFDGQVAYPERLCLQMIAEARDAGAFTFNHARVQRLVASGGRVRAVAVHDGVTGEEHEIPARVVLNAAGPWVDRVLRGLGSVPRQVGGTKGAHIVVDFPDGGPAHAVYSEARADHRPFFVIPWRGRHLVGTTDTRFEGDPASVRAEPEDVAYLVEEARALFPDSGLSEERVLYAYAGVRPLPPSPEGSAGAITRRHLIKDHSTAGFHGLLSVVGGKLSTFRSLADQVVAKIGAQLGDPGSDEPRKQPSAAAESPEAVAAVDSGPDAPLLAYLGAMYGPRLSRLLGFLVEHPHLSQPLCPHGPDLEGQVVFAARHEQAIGLSDALLRRTGAGWNACLGLDCALRAAQLMAHELGWQRERIAHEVAAYVDELRWTFLSPALAASHGLLEDLSESGAHL